MYGHRVLNNFNNISYFITRSWFKDEQSEQSEDEITTIYYEESWITIKSKFDYPDKACRLTTDETYSSDSFSQRLNNVQEI